MERKILTWNDLANKINQMTLEERAEKVKVWGDGRSLCDDVCLTKESEDMCYDEDYPEDGCELIQGLCNMIASVYTRGTRYAERK